MTATLKEKSKKNKNFPFPQEINDNLKEFNTLRIQCKLNGTNRRSAAASLATAQSSIHFHSEGTRTAHTGSYLSKAICRQVQHVFNHRELIPIKKLNRKNHKSLLNISELQESLFKWAVSQLIGVVSTILLGFNDFSVDD